MDPWLEYTKDINKLNKKKRLQNVITNAPGIPKQLKKLQIAVDEDQNGKVQEVSEVERRSVLTVHEHAQTFGSDAAIVHFHRVYIQNIDLHGLTKDEAFTALKTFLINSYNNNVKKILVITGKGNPNNPETIKILTPRWLEYTELKNYITDYGPAPIKYGGSGAIEIIVKKKK